MPGIRSLNLTTGMQGNGPSACQARLLYKSSGLEGREASLFERMYVARDERHGRKHGPLEWREDGRSSCVEAQRGQSWLGPSGRGGPATELQARSLKRRTSEYVVMGAWRVRWPVTQVGLLVALSGR